MEHHLAKINVRDMQLYEYVKKIYGFAEGGSGFGSNSWWLSRRRYDGGLVVYPLRSVVRHGG